jgi:NAD(P)-dependent dehydrogenase (short-subunit alcohol dehydrogenase family)
MDLALKGRRVLVTGATRGIGLACADIFAREGCILDLTARDETRLTSVADDLHRAYGIQVNTISADLSRRSEQKRLADSISDIDILINNAGAVPGGDINQVDDQSWREGWDLKVYGYISLCRALLPRLEAQGYGVIINIIGTVAVRPRPNYIAGSSGNAALQAFTHALGSTSLRHGVRVVGVSPGLIATDRMPTLLKAWATEKYGHSSRWREMLDPNCPPGKPENVADAVAFLASPRAGHISGTVLEVSLAGLIESVM